MNYKIVSAVYYRSIPLTQNQVSVLMALGCAAKDENSLPSPSLARLADRASISMSSASRAIRELVGMGIVTIPMKRKTDKGQLNNVYMVNIEKLGAQTPVTESEYTDSQDDTLVTQTNMVTPTKESQRLSTLVTVTNNNNTNNNQSNNIDIINTQDKTDIINSTANISNASVGVCESSSFRGKDLKDDAVALLTAKGMSEQEARQRIDRVWDVFAEEAKQKDRSTLTNPRKFFAGWLANLAREKGGEQTAEPTTVEGVLAEVVKYYQGVYPKQARHIPGIVSVDGLPQNTVDYICGLEAAKWEGISTPVAKVREMIRGYVSRQVAQYIEDEKEAKAKYIVKMRHHIDEKQCEIMELKKVAAEYGEEANPRHLTRLTEELKNMEQRLAKAKAELAALKAA